MIFYRKQNVIFHFHILTCAISRSGKFWMKVLILYIWTNNTTPYLLPTTTEVSVMSNYVGLGLWFYLPCSQSFNTSILCIFKLIRSHCDFDGCNTASQIQTFTVNILICFWLLNYSEKTDWKNIYWWILDLNMCFCFCKS